MPIHVLKSEERRDRNGKKYKFLTLHDPEPHTIVKFGDIPTPCKQLPKTCGYVAYYSDYTKSQKPDPGNELEEGQVVEGMLVTKKVKPYFIGNDIKDKCTVPVFWDPADEIGFAVCAEEAIERAGKILHDKEVEEETTIKIPDNCLIVKTLKTTR